MKIALGLAVCALLAAGLSASADPAPKVKQNGEACTAAEIANPPVVRVKLSGGVTGRMKVECKTKAQWRFEKAQAADQPRYRMSSNRQWYEPGDTHNTIENAPASSERSPG